MGAKRRRGSVVVAAAAALALTGVVAPGGALAVSAGGGAAAVSGASTPAVVRVAGPAGAVSFGGGDVAVLPTSAALVSGRVSGSRVVGVPGSVPRSVAGAVLVSVTVSGASRAGVLSVAPVGGAGGAVRALSFSRAATASSVLLVGTGAGSLRWSVSAGSPLVTARVVGWVPRTSPLVVPVAPVVRPVLAVPAGGARAVAVAGVGGVARDASMVLVSVRVSVAKPASVALVTGSGVPAARSWLAVPRGVSSWVAAVSPSVAGTLTARSRGAAASVAVSVLGWSSGTTTMRGPVAPVALTVGAPGAVRRVQVAGVGGVPKASAGRTALALVAVTAPAGAVVQLWSKRVNARTVQVARVVGVGGPVTVAVPVAAAGTFDVLVSGRRPATLHLVGWSTDTAKQSVMMAPRPGTRILGPQDVVSVTDDAVVVRGSAAVGEVLMINTVTRGIRYGRVDSAAGLTGGRTRITLATASLPDGFADYRAGYHGAAGATKTVLSAARSTGLSPQGLGVGIPGSDMWTCATTVPATQIIGLDLNVDTDVNLDVSLSERVLDFSIKGRVTATATLKTGVTVSCSGKLKLPFRILLGPTGLMISFDATGSMSLASNDGPGTSAPSASATAVGAVYAALYINGDTIVSDTTTTGSGSGSFQQAVVGSLDLGVQVSIGPATKDIGLDASLSGTIGLSMQYAPPLLFRGPRCVDLVLKPFIEFGANLAIPFFPDLSYTIARKEGPEASLHQGPCWGYVGTASLTYRDSLASDNHTKSDERSYTVVMKPQPATYLSDSQAAQEFTYQANRQATEWINYGGDLSCTTRSAMTGGGQSLHSSGDPRLWTETDTETLFTLSSGVLNGTWDLSCTDGAHSTEAISEFIDGGLCSWVTRADPNMPTTKLAIIDISRTNTWGTPGVGSWQSCVLDVNLQRTEFPASARPQL